MINCPSCGSNFEGDLRIGCPFCGAQSVGPPLAKAEHELASYGRAVMVSAGGLTMCAVFLTYVIMALIEFKGFPPRWSSIVNAGEVASWRLKWVTLPLAIVVLWGGARIIRSIKASPEKFIGLRTARVGFAASALVTVLIATLIGITVPVRLERREWANEAAAYARSYTLARAQLEYRDRNGMLPSQDELVRELSTLPDPDGSIAEALRNLDVSGYELRSTVLAAASTKGKALVQRGSAIRNAAPSTDPATDRGVSFTSYKWRLPGEDKILNTDDDVILQDGLITKVSEPSSSSSTKTRPNAP
ncbi:MAG: hypothetical protein QOH41_182 [Blastocatellia bacterium]|nr:hypothetical protein [Blastocatellia bacterium]